MIADDAEGLSRDEIEGVLKHCPSYQLLVVEIAIDFSPSTGVNRQFIRGHAVFGKSRRRAGKKNINLNYGSRKSGKYVRCYKKTGIGVYRVELELHSSLLRRLNIYGLDGLDDLVRLPGVVCPKHIADAKP